MPAVSVVMAFHRVTPFLRPAVRSVLDQTERDLELLLVDNGTGAGRGALAEDGADPRIRLLAFPTNAGIARAHNHAVTEARGEFIALLDHDDVARPGRLAAQLALLRAQPRLGLVAGRAETIDESGRVIGREFAVLDGAAQREYSRFAAPVVTPAYTGRREVFRDVPYREEFALTADFDFLARAAERWPCAGVDEVVLHYRRHAAQATQVHTARIAAERGVVRLLTARRRAGRPEGDEWRELLTAAAAVTDEATAQFDLARRFTAEGFPVEAAFHARRGLAARRTPGGALTALGLALSAWQRAGENAAETRRMFLRGPVRALGLVPTERGS